MIDEKGYGESSHTIQVRTLIQKIIIYLFKKCFKIIEREF